jgi:hypothetical protein
LGPPLKRICVIFLTAMTLVDPPLSNADTGESRNDDTRHTAPIVLDYAAPQIRWRLSSIVDLEVAWLSLVQLIAWCLAFFAADNGRPFWGDHWTLFALAWHYNYTGDYQAAVGVLTSVALLITAFRPIAKRLVWYRAYFALMVPAVALHWAAQQYLVYKCPGAWGSLLFPEHSSRDSSLAVLVIHPVFWSLLFRSLLPPRWNRVGLTLIIFLLTIAGVFALTVGIASVNR